MNAAANAPVPAAGIGKPITKTAPVTPRLAPHSVEAEEAVLGALLLNPSDLAEIAAMIEPRDFFIERNEWVFDAMLSLWRDGLDVDALTLCDHLQANQRLDALGGPVYLTYLMNATPGLSAPTYALLIQRASDRRKLMEYHRQRYIAAETGEDTVATLYSEDMQGLIDLKPRALDQALTPGTAISARFLELQDQDADAVRIFPLPFGGDEGLPFMTGGKLFGIGGDEKTGKSALAETLSEHWAILGHRGFYIHTEEKPDAKINRRFSRWSGIPFLKLEAGQLSELDCQRREKALCETAPWEHNLDLWYESLPTPGRIMLLMQRAIQVYRASFIVLDNFTDVDFSGIPNSSPAQEANKLLQRIDDLAAKHGVLIVLVTQMSTQLDGKRIAYGTSGFNKKMTWFWDINRKTLKEPLSYEADGQTHHLKPGAFDPRVDIYVPASRYGSSAKISVFADLRRFYWRSRGEVHTVESQPVINHRKDIDGPADDEPLPF